MNVGSLCKRAIVTIDAECTLREAAQKMLEQHVGAIVVTTRSGDRRDVLGLVTDRDLALSCVAHDLNPAEVLVGAIASRDLVCVLSSSSPTEAAERLGETGVRRLLVCDANGKLAGLLSSDDLLGALMEPLHALAGAFRTGIQREEARRDPARLAPPPALFIAAQDHTELA